MKNINEMISALKEIGKEWHKNDMHRFYIDIASADDMYRNMDDDKREHGSIPVNRYEKSNGKVWIDMVTGEIETKYIRDAEGVIGCIREMIA